MRNRQLRAFALVITLFTLTVVGMLVGATLLLVPRQLEGSLHTGERERAYQAAQSGLAYARNRIRQEGGWRGTGNRVTVDTPELRVVEDQGNVVGTLTAPDGNISQFKIRFNYQNGSAAASLDDGLPDPASANRINLPYISTNNVQGKSALAPHVREVNSVITTVGEVPSGGCVIVVQGSAGQGLNRGGSGRRVVSSVLEVWLARESSTLYDSAIYAPNRIQANMSGVLDPTKGSKAGSLDVRSSLSSARPKIRGLNGVTVTGASNPPYKTESGGEVFLSNDSSAQFMANGVTSSSPSASREDASAQKSRWPRIKWADVPKASSSDPNLIAGTYVWRQSGKLEYYKQNYSGSAPSGTPDRVISDGGEMLASGSGVSLVPGKFATRFAGNFYVQAQGSVNSFTIMAEPTLEATGNRSSVFFDGKAGKGSRLSGPGDVNLLGASRGTGSVASEGSINLQGDSIFEVGLDDNIAMYARKDLTVNPIPPGYKEKIDNSVELTQDFQPYQDPPALPAAVASTGTDTDGRMSLLVQLGGGGFTKVQAISLPFFRDIEPSVLLTPSDAAFQGVLYAQNNFKANLGGGNFFLRGVLAVYGGNPDSQLAGSLSSEGKVNLDAASANFLYDPSYMQNLMNQTGYVNLAPTLWYLR